MNRVSTIGLQTMLLGRTLNTQSRVQDLQIQSSSGKVSTTYKGIAGATRQLLDMESLHSQNAAFQKNVTTVDQRLGMMEGATSQIGDIAIELRALLVNATSGDNAEFMVLDQEAKGLLSQVANLLNTDYDGRYLFAGSRIDTLPIDLDALFDPQPALVDATTLAVATSGALGLTEVPGIAAVEVLSGDDGNAYQLTYDGLGTLTMTNLATGISGQASLTAAPGPGSFTQLDFTVGEDRVVLSIDETFPVSTPIVVDPLSYTPGGGANTISNLQVISVAGDITKLTAADIQITGAASAAATLTLSSSDGDFVATNVDLSATGASPQQVTLQNSQTGAAITLRLDLAGDIGAGALGTASIALNDFFGTVAATDGTVAPETALPGDLAYDPENPSYYKGDSVRLSVRADETLEVDYGVTAIDGGFEKLIRALYLTYDAGAPGAIDQDRLEEALGLVKEAVDEIPEITAGIGTARKVLEEAGTTLGNSQLLAEQAIAGIEDVDPAETITRLTQATTQIQASYMAITQMSRVSLLDYLG